MFTCIVIFCKKNDKVLKAATGLIFAITVVQFVWLSAVMMKNGNLDTRYAISPTDKDFTFNLGGFEYMPLRDDDGIPYMNMLMENEECQTTNAEISNYSKYLTNINVHIKTGAVDVNTGDELLVYNSTSSARLAVIVPADYDSDVKVYYAGKTTWHIAEVVSAMMMVFIILYSAYLAMKNRMTTVSD